MGNKQAKQASTEITDKRSFFFVENIYYWTKFGFIFILEIALLQANTQYTTQGRHIHNHSLPN